MTERDLPAQFGYQECPHPGCRRPWHGLPAAYINPFWPACPGSWAYEQGNGVDHAYM